MEFDKSRVFTALNADELRAGDKVIVADTLKDLKSAVDTALYVYELTDILTESSEDRFFVNDRCYLLAYLVERVENCTNCIYEGSAGCSIVEICGENKLTHRCHMYEAKDTKRNLCDSCKHSFAECSATANDIIFGDGVGNDNVYECDKYEQKSTVRCINCEHYSTYGGYCHKHDEPTMYGNTCPDYRLVKPKTEQKAEMPELISLGNGQYAERKHYRPFKDTDELIKVWCDKCPAHNHRERGLTMPLIWVKDKESGDIELISMFGRVEVFTREYTDLNDLFDDFTFLDGSVCGVEE